MLRLNQLKFRIVQFIQNRQGRSIKYENLSDILRLAVGTLSRDKVSILEGCCHHEIGNSVPVDVTRVARACPNRVVEFSGSGSSNVLALALSPVTRKGTAASDRSNEKGARRVMVQRDRHACRTGRIPICRFIRTTFSRMPVHWQGNCTPQSWLIVAKH